MAVNTPRNYFLSLSAPLLAPHRPSCAPDGGVSVPGTALSRGDVHPTLKLHELRGGEGGGGRLELDARVLVDHPA